MATFVELVLAALQFQAEGLLDIADDLLAPGGMRTLPYFPIRDRQWFKKNWADLYRDRRQFYRTLNHLKRQGLVVKKKHAAASSWMLTRDGKEKKRRDEERRQDPFSSAQAVFAKPHGGGITVISYDIPERERRKRDWIRMCLMEMDCEKIQKSVWVGRGALDENFMHALRARDLLGRVHIFMVTKYGTIKASVT